MRSAETTWQELQASLGVAANFARRLKAYMDALPRECAECGEPTVMIRLMRLADHESERYFGKLSSEKNCKVAMRRICSDCQVRIRDGEGFEAFFKRLSKEAGITDIQ